MFVINRVGRVFLYFWTPYRAVLNDNARVNKIYVLNIPMCINLTQTFAKKYSESIKMSFINFLWTVTMQFVCLYAIIVKSCTTSYFQVRFGPYNTNSVDKKSNNARTHSNFKHVLCLSLIYMYIVIILLEKWNEI